MPEYGVEFPGTLRGDAYPWDEWIQGRGVIRFEAGVDFHCTGKSFRECARTALLKRGYTQYSMTSRENGRFVFIEIKDEDA